MFYGNSAVCAQDMVKPSVTSIAMDNTENVYTPTDEEIFKYSTNKEMFEEMEEIPNLEDDYVRGA